MKTAAQLPITFGSSYKTSDFIVDALEAWWAALDEDRAGGDGAAADQNG